MKLKGGGALFPMSRLVKTKIIRLCDEFFSKYQNRILRPLKNNSENMGHVTGVEVKIRLAFVHSIMHVFGVLGQIDNLSKIKNSSSWPLEQFFLNKLAFFRIFFQVKVLGNDQNVKIN